MSVLYPRKQAKLAGKAGDGRLAYPHGKGQRPHMADDGRAGIPPWERAASPYGNAALPPVLFLYAPAPFCAAPCAI